MNEHLSERFSKSRRGKQPPGQSRADVLILPPKLNPRIREYYEGAGPSGGSWLSRPEIPTAEEVLDTDTTGGANSDIVELAENKPKGAFEDKEEYLNTHYELLREDAVAPLRDAVSRVRSKPLAGEDAFDGQIGIYDKVHVCGVTTSTRGIAVHITFSLFKTGKKIIWEQSKRLITGSLVVLTPKSDMFRTTAIVATVAARPLQNLLSNPPEVDLFFARAEELEIDPAAEYVMIEERSGFYEANRHTLLALQHMMKETFPLDDHLVDVKRDVSAPPQHLVDKPARDMQSVFHENSREAYSNINLLKDWPERPTSDMDASQLNALRSMLTQRLAIVQGPPGTGKTFVSVQAVKAMLANHRDGDPPIIIACQTNHAVDQILRHIAKFEKKFVRLGGRSKDRDVIKKRTLYEVRQQDSENPPAGCYARPAGIKMREIEKEVALLLTPLQYNKKPLNHRILENLKLLTKKQADSLETGASRWVQDKKTHVTDARMPFTVWLGEKLIAVPPKQLPEEFGFDFEEAELEFEQLREIEAENQAKDDEEFESLTGRVHALADNFTCLKLPGMSTKVEDLLSKEQDLWRIPEATRPAVYCYLQAKQKDYILSEFCKKAREYDDQASKRRIGNWERDEIILKQQRVIGMTTTGLSKYRPLLSALQPKVVLMEEAAETLEAPVAAACVPSLQQLILVGDHLQLRPSASFKTLENGPYFLNVSLFERLINNGIGHVALNVQRRMIPEVRRLLYPIYEHRNKIKILDHPDVLDPVNRPDVPGMGGVNSLFFAHHWAEQRDDQMSCYNAMEADMIVGFFLHLLHNGVDAGEITVLTFYNGQRKRILAELRRNIVIEDARKFKVVTVDSYQGEENKIVILSLVRSNKNRQVGFLNVDNRVCVALSRAQCGFYIFGNAELLYGASKTWKLVIEIIAGKNKKKQNQAPVIQPNRLSEQFAIQCSNHKRSVTLQDPEAWEGLVGGCATPCKGTLPCGHACEILCHPFSHDIVNCHKCRPKTTLTEGTPDMTPPCVSGPAPRSHSASTSTSSWQSYSEEEPKRKVDQMAKYTPISKQSLLDVDSMEPSVRKLPAQLDGVNESVSGFSDKTVVPATHVSKVLISETSSTKLLSVASDMSRKKWKETYVVNGQPVPQPAKHEKALEVEDLIDLS